MSRFGILLLVLIWAGSAPSAAGQPAVSVDLLNSIRPVKFSAIAAGELFGELATGDDLFIIGQLSNGLPQASIYRLQNRTVDFVLVPPYVAARFTEESEAQGISLRDVSFGDAVIADMDGNGENDILYTGRTLFDILPTENVYGEFTGLYLNFTAASEEATFVLNASTGMPALSESRLAVADFDGDGQLDVVLAGDRDAADDVTDLHLGVYLNGLTTIGRFDASQTWESGVRPTTVTTGDVDGDGDQDFLVGGSLADGSPVVRLYLNDGDASFSEMPGALPQLRFPAADFGDIDGDGDEDVLLSGGRIGPTILYGETRLYSWNEGVLEPRTDTDLAGVFYGRVAFADLENDGDLDFFVHGMSDPANITGQRLVIYRNNFGSFTVVSDTRSVVFGGAAWIDYDGNGRREVIVAGERDNARRAIIYEIF